MIQRPSQFRKVDKFESPAMAEIRRCFQRPIFSSIVVSRDPERVVRFSKNFQITGVFVVAVTKNETACACSLNENLTESVPVA